MNYNVRPVLSKGFEEISPFSRHRWVELAGKKAPLKKSNRFARTSGGGELGGKLK